MAMKALDNRAATYEKLGELNKALKDAKSMIELMPEVSKVRVVYKDIWKHVLTITGLPAMRQNLAA